MLAAGSVLTVLVFGETTAQEATKGSPFRFVDATPASGIRCKNVCGAVGNAKGWLFEGMGAGAAWLDYDGDGNLDLYIVNGSTIDRPAGGGEPNQLFRGDGHGKFVNVTERARVGDRGWGYGVAIGDIDNDGDADIFVTNSGPNVLYRNEGDGTFTDVTAKAKLGNPFWSTSSAFFDMEGDGDLDLYVANYMVGDPDKVPRRDSEGARPGSCYYKGVPVFCGPLGQTPHQDALYRNNGDGTFTDVTKQAGVALETPRYSLGVVSADYDNDGDQDLYVANDSVQNSLWRNDGKGNFEDVGVTTLAALNADGRTQAGMGTDFGDYNGDGWLDLVVTNFSHDLNTIYRSMGGKFFIDDSMLTGLGVTNMALSWGTGFRDFDRDGDLDLFIANGHVYPMVDDYDIGTKFRQRNHLFLNERDRFKESAASSGDGLAILRSFRGAAFGDYDNDGDVDIFLTALDDEGLLLRNDSPSPGHFVQLHLIGGPSNRDAVGARVTLQAGGRAQIREHKGGGSYLSGSDPRLHFGIGEASAVERLQIRWPSGKTELLEKVPIDRLITVREGQGIVE
jgi:hypothetical protein